MYEASTSGRVRSLPRIDACNRRKAVKVLKQTPRGPGQYLAVNLYRNGTDCVMRVVHQIILETFIGPRPSPLHEGSHLDGNKANNAATNLAWKTHQENIDDKKLHGTTLHGEKNPSAKITAIIAVEIRKDFASGMRKTHIAKARNISRSMVYNIVTGRNWNPES